MANLQTCPLCNDEAEVRDDFKHGSFGITCRRCGHYKITEDAEMESQTLARLRPFLSAATRQASENRKPITLTTENVSDEARVHRETSPSTRLDKTLLYLARTRPGQLTTIKLSHDFTVVSAESSAEFSLYLDYLKEKGLITRDMRPGDEFQCMLTVPGRLAVEPVLADCVGTWYERNLYLIRRKVAIGESWILFIRFLCGPIWAVAESSHARDSAERRREAEPDGCRAADA